MALCVCVPQSMAGHTQWQEFSIDFRAGGDIWNRTLDTMRMITIV